MKTYTTEEVIQLNTEYWSKYWAKVPTGTAVSFDKWLLNKEQSEIPVKGQIIWVRDVGDHKSYYGKWQERIFSHIIDGRIYCLQDQQPDKVVEWDEYSITDPNR